MIIIHVLVQKQRNGLLKNSEKKIYYYFEAETTPRVVFCRPQSREFTGVRWIGKKRKTSIYPSRVKFAALVYIYTHYIQYSLRAHIILYKHIFEFKYIVVFVPTRIDIRTVHFTHARVRLKNNWTTICTIHVHIKHAGPWTVIKIITRP